jgi:3-methyladenine DNA glycosylase AlkD
MKKSEVIALLKEHRNERGLKHWERLGPGTGGLKSFGIGLTQLRKIAKLVGRDHKLALQLWNTDNHDAKVVGLLIDEPGQLTRAQIEEQVEGVGAGYLSHAFSSCDATLPKAAFALEVAKDWMRSKDAVRRSCAYGLLYELSKDKRNKELTDAFFLECVQRIEQNIATEESSVRLAMAGALMGIGKRNQTLNKAAVKLAKALGPIEYDTGGTGCEPFDVLKHLTSDYLRKKLGT